MNDLLPLAIVIPLAGAAVSLLAIRSRATQRVVAILCAVATTAIAVTIVVHVDRNGTATAAMGGWPGRIAINLVADRFSALMLTVGSTMLLAVLLYAIGQRADDERSRWYHPAYLVLTAGVSGAFLAGDLFNLFVFFEVLLMASYVLLTLEGTDGQIRSGTTYVVLNVVESMVLVTGVALIFAATGTLNMAELPERLAALPDGIRLGLNLLLLIAFGLKAAVFPLFSWLPDSYPAAPSPVSAVFAGLLTKIGVYAIVRTQTLLFPETNRTLLLVVAGLTMAIGGLRSDRPVRHEADPELPHHQPDRLHGHGCGARRRSRHQRDDLLHAPPHPGEDLAVPGRGHRGTRHRLEHPGQGLRTGPTLWVARCAVPDPGAQSRRTSALQRVPRQVGCGVGGT